jgi:hypothetical protein
MFFSESRCDFYGAGGPIYFWERNPNRGKFHFRRIRQPIPFRLGVPNAFPSVPMEVRILKLDVSQSNCDSGFASGNHHPYAELITCG